MPAHDLGPARDEAGAGRGQEAALGHVEAALEVPGVEGEGDELGARGGDGLDDGAVRAEVGDGRGRGWPSRTA